MLFADKLVFQGRLRPFSRKHCTPFGVFCFGKNQKTIAQLEILVYNRAVLWKKYH